MSKEFLSLADAFATRLRAHPEDRLDVFAEAEILTGVPFIFSTDDDSRCFHDHVAGALGLESRACEVLIVGSARTGFSLDPDRWVIPFREASDIDVVVVDQNFFDEAWYGMLAWDYLTMKNRTQSDRNWLASRREEVWSGWHYPSKWLLRERAGINLSFPDALKPLRDFSHRWFAVFRSLSRYRHHPEIARHHVTARLYRTRRHAAMYQAMGLRILRRKLSTPES